MFEKQLQQIIDSLKTQNPAKSWLVIGPKGIGKKDFAKSLSCIVTHNNNDYNPLVKWIDCGLTEAAKKEIQKIILAGEKLEEKEWGKKTQITVEDIREGCRFLSLKSDKIKILIINLADNMNENAQNALLKTLEEPYQNSLILLLCENTGHLLPTILSRCLKVHLPQPDFSVFSKTMSKRYPQLSEDDLLELAFLSDNIIKQAEYIIQQDGLILYHKLLSFLCPTQNLNIPELISFSEEISKDKDRFEFVENCLLKQLNVLAKNVMLQSMEKAYLISNLYSEVKSLFGQVNTMNLDKKEVLISIIHQIGEIYDN